MSYERSSPPSSKSLSMQVQSFAKGISRMLCGFNNHLVDFLILVFDYRSEDSREFLNIFKQGCSEGLVRLFLFECWLRSIR